MADSVTSADIPSGYPLVGYYVDGLYAWSDADRRRHQASILVGITVTGNTLDAQVADVENGDLTAAQGADWAFRKIQAGQFPWLYFSYSRFGEVAAAVHARGIPDNQWAAWIALWDGKAQLLPNNALKQYANPTLSGGHYDLSIAADYLPGIDPAPVPVPPPAPPPPVSVPPPDSPPPFVTPPPLPPPAVDQTRSAWANLAAFFTQDIPAFIAEILRLLGLYNKTS